MDNASAEALFLAQQNSDKTKATYARGLRLFRAFTQDKPFADVTDADCIAWKQSFAQDGSAATSQFSAWTAVRSYYTWLERSGRIARSPFTAVKGPRVTRNRSPRIPDDATILALFGACDGEDARSRRDLAVLHMLANGLRIAEVANLKLTDLRVDDTHKAVIARVVGKGDKERLVPLSVPTVNALQRWLFARPESAFLFTDGTKGMTPRQVQEVVYRAARTAGTKRVNPHSLRHHYATRLIRAGVDVFTVQRLLGHESLNTTQVYVNLDISDSLVAVAKDPLIV